MENSKYFPNELLNTVDVRELAKLSRDVLADHCAPNGDPCQCPACQRLALLRRILDEVLAGDYDGGISSATLNLLNLAVNGRFPETIEKFFTEPGETLWPKP